MASVKRPLAAILHRDADVRASMGKLEESIPEMPQAPALCAERALEGRFSADRKLVN